MKFNLRAYLRFSTHFYISKGRICLILLFILFSVNAIAQIKVFERAKNDDFNNETIFQSDKRIKINLNGQWNVSFNNSGNYSRISVPFATDYESSIYLKRDIIIPDSLLNKYNFIFYSEGMNYESEVQINDVIISRNNGGCKFIFNEIQENTLKSTNTISIKINGELNNSGTFPLSSQINYARNYNGLLSNVYIYAVPKIYISETLFNYTFSDDNTISLVNKINVNTLNIDSLISDGSNFFITTAIYRKSDSAKLFESPLTKLDAKSYQNYKVSNNVTLRNVDLWSAEKPALYVIKTSILLKDDLIDNITYETGFRKVNISGAALYVNNNQIKLKGLNYFEDLPSFAGAMDYTATEKDLKSIKDLGFNCVRVPGKSAHPFIIKVAQRIGLYVLQEYPFNEVPSQLLSNDKFIKNALDYSENIVKRDMHSPAVLFWGIGNDFDVTTTASENYASKIKELIKSIDDRPVYYTTKNFENDRVANIINIKGFNIDEINFIDAKLSIDKISKTNFNFISAVGVSSDNTNRNGYGDIRSAEYQAKYLTEIINSVSLLSGFILNSYADYNSESPLLIHYDDNNPYLRTNGIYDYNRNPKYSYNIIKRVLNNQGYQKIPEGNVNYTYANSSNYFVIIGLILFILLMLSLSKIRHFKENIWKSIITPKNFLYLIKEQNAIPAFHNFILMFILSAVISLLFSSIIYNLRLSPNFDFLLSKLVGFGSFKIFIVNIIDVPVLLFVFLFIIIIGLFFLAYLSMLFVIKLIKRNVKLRSSFTVFVWSFVLFLVFLPFGIIFSKTINFESSTVLYFSFYLYFGVLFYSTIKLINGSKYVFDLGVIKSYLYGLLFIVTMLLINYYYFIAYKSIDVFFNLINSYR